MPCTSPTKTSCPAEQGGGRSFELSSVNGQFFAEALAKKCLWDFLCMECCDSEVWHNADIHKQKYTDLASRYSHLRLEISKVANQPPWAFSWITEIQFRSTEVPIIPTYVAVGGSVGQGGRGGWTGQGIPHTTDRIPDNTLLVYRYRSTDNRQWSVYSN